MTTKKILIVDDEAAIVAVLEELLTEEGYTIIKAYNGLEAISIFNKKQHIDLMIVDYCMPHLNGRRVIETMRQNPRYSTTPVIVITGSEKQFSNFPEDSTYQFLIEKPFNLERITETVHKLLG
ncbi:response regulator [Desulfuribacillus alkaliarsenatis]|uniref:Response regulatory domain-containing protein n=1 Tax=Desulfuribacillus alkaliarsenatis TaxID=766136 RepID=A0A1E5G330_9FIRM|nr:response regulator [Desulfuribacillus alkaliarsenatis]OEF97482.1 hypothetical protein BHF68_04560 [Desulfuribacillus alkaliarsenatis]